mmetsp:Transcript_2367/g.5015  ORF Transcript_2367/g.5015 Transcript_2367/m.5015 type:complete len:179 (-) Transcript_2367:45-581(-)
MGCASSSSSATTAERTARRKALQHSVRCHGQSKQQMTGTCKVSSRSESQVARSNVVIAVKPGLEEVDDASTYLSFNSMSEETVDKSDSTASPPVAALARWPSVLQAEPPDASVLAKHMGLLENFLDLVAENPSAFVELVAAARLRVSPRDSEGAADSNGDATLGDADEGQPHRVRVHL